MRFLLPIALLLSACSIQTPQEKICNSDTTYSYDQACQKIISAVNENQSCQDAGVVGSTDGCPGLLAIDAGATCAGAEFYCTPGVDACAANIQNLDCQAALETSCAFECGRPQ